MTARAWMGVGLWVLLCLAGLGVLAAGVMGPPHDAAQRHVERTWGVTLPANLELVESHSEPGFHGDGYRISVFAWTSDAAAAETFPQVGVVSREPLTQAERKIVTEANAQFSPQHLLDPDGASLVKLHATKPGGWTESEFVLVVHDRETDRVHVYESFI